MMLATVGGIGYVLLATVDSVGVRYLGVFLAASGIFPSEWFNPPLSNQHPSNATLYRYSKHITLGDKYVLDCLNPLIHQLIV